MNGRHPESIAISHILLIHEILARLQPQTQNDNSRQGQDQKKPGKSLRTRLREAPNLLLSSGPAGLITFYLSKTNKDIIDTLTYAFIDATQIDNAERAREILECRIVKLKDNNETRKKFNTIKDEFIGSEGGYTIVVAMIAAFANSQGLITLSPLQPEPEQDSQARNIINSIAELAKKTLDDPAYAVTTTTLLLPYLTTAKRLAEAIIKVEDENKEGV
ncbi:MAG: type III-B CRISPR module-associated protein Cmr5 [Desulfurococcales archaeon]|nr:type III-B CRISPR module-associated protein Cmr5 [Desulfurococcales archaeon]